ncbi:hypothetical protein WN55_07113 [Dufourea novaeangliae]|uniref:Uncharacterized protein n=1 Tax=Dufourea novaeangliae TaxID=178035 RepID=A0A154P2E2_DUFNO|nr:hypothetical protein WN55_07113 [Dufourea novaeangliae]
MLDRVVSEAGGRKRFDGLPELRAWVSTKTEYRREEISVAITVEQRDKDTRYAIFIRLFSHVLGIIVITTTISSFVTDLKTNVTDTYGYFAVWQLNNSVGCSQDGNGKPLGGTELYPAKAVELQLLFILHSEDCSNPRPLKIDAETANHRAELKETKDRDREQRHTRNTCSELGAATAEVWIRNVKLRRRISKENGCSSSQP